MATESPICMMDSTGRWPVPKKSTRRKSSSGKFLLEDLSFFLGSSDIPSRCKTAPPNMEGSLAAIRNFQGSTLNLEETRDFSSISLDSERHSHADVSLKFPKSSLPVHAEESEDDRSSVRSSSVSAEKTAVMVCSSGTLFNSKEDDSFSSSYPSHAQSNSFQVEPGKGTFVLDSDSHLQNFPAGMNASCSDRASQVSSPDESKEIKVWPYMPNSEPHDLHKEGQSSHQDNAPQHLDAPPLTNLTDMQGVYPHTVHPGVLSPYGGVNLLRSAASGVSVPNIQPMLHASGYTSPLYANATAFIPSPSLYYPYMQPAGAGYAGPYNFNPAVYASGYPQQTVAFYAMGGTPYVNSGVPNGTNVHSYDPQYYLKYSGQASGHQYPHSNMNYLHPNLRDPYSYYGYIGHQTSVNQINPLNAGKSSDIAGTSNAYKSPQLPDTSSNTASQRRNVPGHFNPKIQKDPDSRVHLVNASAKSVSGTNFSAMRHSTSLSHASDSIRNKTNEHIQVLDGSSTYFILEELKSGKGQRFELYDIAGHIVEFSVDQYGSRFIQKKLEFCSNEEKESVLQEIIPNASKLITDVFGNYVIQKLFEHGSASQRKYLTNQLEGEILNLSLHMYGCRVIQKALEVIDLEEKIKLVRELEGHVKSCVYDQNGNHVIQKCIESIPMENIRFVISSFRGHVDDLSMHPYGCRVIQRILERCNEDEDTQFIVDEILDAVVELAQDQYGNYVTQQVLMKGKPHERKEIVEKLAGSVVQLSQHKFASNVIEKCIEFSDSASRELLIQNIVGHAQNDNLLIMMKDQYANYVVQRILEKSSSEQRDLLLNLIRNHLNTLKKYTYGKHIVTRFERLCGDEDGS